MGLNFGTLSKIFLGIGLGLLAFSCLVVTVCYGDAANKVEALVKIRDQIKSNSSLYSCEIAIAVLGCLSAVAALVAIALSIIMEGQTLILIIVGGVSAVFAFGCIVAEGVFTLQFEKRLASITEYSHKNAQKYIKNAIEELYKQAVKNLQDEYGNDKLPDLPDWSKAKNWIGSEQGNTIVTYGNIWKSYSSNINNITLTRSEHLIKATYKDNNYNNYESIVASLKFYHKGDIQNKRRACWYKEDWTGISCKNINEEKFKNEIFTYYADDEYYVSEWTDGNREDFMLTENIVVGDYLSELDEESSEKTVEYKVSNFPFAYHLLSYQEVDKIKKQMEQDKNNDDYDPDNYFIFEDSTNKFKVSGKKFAKAIFNMEKKSRENPEEHRFLLAPSEPKDYEDYIKKCEEYKAKKDDNENEEEKEENNFICYDGDYEEGVYYYYADEYIQHRYKDNNRGKTAPSIKKRRMKEAREYAKIYDDSFFLYTTAIINLIIQIFGIIFWACGRFLGMLLGSNDEKTPSEGEA